MNYIKYCLLFSCILIFVSCSENSIGIDPISKQSNYKILFVGNVNGEAGLFTIESDGLNIKKISDFTDCFSPKWTPDGKNIMYLKVRSDNDEIFIMDSTGLNEKKITDGNEFIISPNGNIVCYIFFNKQEISWEVYSCNIDGSNKVKLTNTKRQKFRLYWSPINSEIVFTENDNISGTYENIYRINTDNGLLDTLATGYELPLVSDWSKDGHYILFGGNHADVFKINLLSKQITQLTNAFMRDENARFSSDGRKILFESGRESKIQVYLMNSDGTSQKKVSKYVNGSAFPQWSPDGTSISYITATDSSLLKIVITNSVGNNERFLVPDINSAEYYFDWHPVRIK